MGPTGWLLQRLTYGWGQRTARSRVQSRPLGPHVWRLGWDGWSCEGWSGMCLACVSLHSGSPWDWRREPHSLPVSPWFFSGDSGLQEQLSQETRGGSRPPPKARPGTGRVSELWTPPLDARGTKPLSSRFQPSTALYRPGAAQGRTSYLELEGPSPLLSGSPQPCWADECSWGDKVVPEG